MLFASPKAGGIAAPELTAGGQAIRRQREPTRYQATAAQTALLDVAYERDNIGRITRRHEVVGSSAVYTYTYDLVGQLTDVYKNNALFEHYTYDPNGNRVATISTQGNSTATYDAQDRLEQWGGTIYSYGPNGELAQATDSNNTTTYTYDVMGNLQTVTLPSGTIITYLHDALNRRIGKKVNGTLVQGWLYADALFPIAELDGAGNIVSQFVYGTRLNVPDYMIKGGRTYRILADHVGSPRLVVDTANATIAQRLDYDVWGTILADTAPGFQPFGFAGGLYDQHTGFTRMGARDYNASIGRWTTKDPIGFAGGDPNLYRSVGNDPVNFIDPTGLLSASAWARIGRASRLGALGAITGFGGSIAGQLLSQKLGLMCPKGIDWNEALVAAGVGAVFGPMGSQVATRVGSVAYGAVSNVVQYGATEYLHGRAPTIVGGGLSIVVGGIIGGATGPYTKIPISKANDARQIPEWMWNRPKMRDGAVANIITTELNVWNITGSNFAKSMSASAASNANWAGLGTSCSCSK